MIKAVVDVEQEVIAIDAEFHLANIGSEVERALGWKARNNPVYCQQAFERILELLDFTLCR